MKISTCILSLCLLLNVSVAIAALPEYEAPLLLARANIEDGYNLPPMSYLSNPSPVINTRGDVAIKIMGFDGQTNHGLWLKPEDEKNGKIVYTAPESRFMTDPSLNNSGQVVFNLYEEGITDGLLLLDTQTGNVEQVLNPDDKDIAYYTYSQLLDDGKIFFRGTNGNNERTFFSYIDKQLKPIITEGMVAYGQKSSYLFRPVLNPKGEMVFKRRIGEKGQWDESNPDEILLLKPNLDQSFDSVVIARDRDADPASFYLGFNNTATVSKNGLVAFTAVLENSQRALVLYRDGILKNLAVEKADDISEIEMFTPKVNDRGLVAFRARDLDGKRGIYIATNDGIKKLISEGDEVKTDLGMARILSNPNYPGFSGEIDMNENGDIVFSCLLVSSADNNEWGTALFKISPKK